MSNLVGDELRAQFIHCRQNCGEDVRAFGIRLMCAYDSLLQIVVNDEDEEKTALVEYRDSALKGRLFDGLSDESTKRDYLWILEKFPADDYGAVLIKLGDWLYEDLPYCEEDCEEVKRTLVEGSQDVDVDVAAENDLSEEKMDIIVTSEEIAEECLGVKLVDNNVIISEIETDDKMLDCKSMDNVKFITGTGRPDAGAGYDRVRHGGTLSLKSLLVNWGEILSWIYYVLPSNANFSYVEALSWLFDI